MRTEKVPKPLTARERGMLFALATLQQLHGCHDVIADTIWELGLNGSDCSPMSDWDKKRLATVCRRVNGSGRALSLRGLKLTEDK
jgi:hypothetical protein